MTAIHLHPEVADALSTGRPVVALESAVITHGLPREGRPTADAIGGIVKSWDHSAPLNLELARAMQCSVREAGAVPATIAVFAGRLRCGLDDAELEQLAADVDAAKASIANLARTLAGGGNAGTTVSATLAASALTHADSLARKSLFARKMEVSLPGIRVFATGGIGGVHRAWQERPDISADLIQLSRTQVCVVCSGAKSLLDIPATLEMMETLGIPVAGYRATQFPQFYSAGIPDVPTPIRVDSPEAAASLCRQQWLAARLPAGVLVASPVPAEAAIPHQKLEEAIALADRAADAHHIAGPARTPYMLAKLAELTHGRSVDANIALLLSNATLAAQIAIAAAQN